MTNELSWTLLGNVLRLFDISNFVCIAVRRHFPHSLASSLYTHSLLTFSAAQLFKYLVYTSHSMSLTFLKTEIHLHTDSQFYDSHMKWKTKRNEIGIIEVNLLHWIHFNVFFSEKIMCILCQCAFCVCRFWQR